MYCLDRMMNTQNLLTQKLKCLLSQIPADSILAVVEDIYRLKMEPKELERMIHMLQEQLQMLVDEDEQDFYRQSDARSCGIDIVGYQSLEKYLRKDIEEIIELSHSNTPARISRKIHLSNNIVRWLRGPAKLMFDGTMHVFDVFAQGTHISEAALQAVKRAYDKQEQTAFVEITSDWIFEGVNPNQGFNSPSIWMRDPRGRRILFKTQGHPICAANEWLAYKLGKQLDLPVNEVQISVYQNNLVTLHTDVAREDEKTLTFMELPRQARRTLLTDPIMGCMDLLDHMIQNVDRNQRNILITMPKTSTIDDAGKMQIHLIDHASCFGMGKYSIISLIACKFHTNHLSIYKFDPVIEAKKFKQYLSRIPVEDRQLIGSTLNRLASMTNHHIDHWMNEIEELLSPSQCNRIRDLLYRERDIAKSYVSHWEIESHSVIYL